MNIDATIDGKKVTIELTTEQVDSIKAQTSGFSKYTDITSVLDAVKHLENIGQSVSNEDKTTKTGQIRTFARAVNSLISNKSFPNWNDGNEEKHYPIFIFKNGIWVFYCSYCYYFYSYGLPGFYKTNAASNHAAKMIPDLYIEVMNQKF